MTAQSRLALLLCIAAAWFMVFTQARAQTVTLPAYPGCTFGWDYPADQEQRISNFTLVLDDINDRVNYVRVQPNERTVPCSAFALTPGIHTLYAWAYSSTEKRKSEAASLLFEYKEAVPAPIPMPSSMRVIMEWTVEE